jgi:hypothetical protein
LDATDAELQQLALELSTVQLTEVEVPLPSLERKIVHVGKGLSY